MQTTNSSSRTAPGGVADDRSGAGAAAEDGDGEAGEPAELPRSQADLDAPLYAFPTLRAAATMLYVAPSTLSRRTDVTRLPRGERDLTLAPAEVMRLAALYRKRSLNEVAAELIALARASGSESEAQAIEREVDGFFTGHDRHEPNEEWFAVARRQLPPNLYEEVERVIKEGRGRAPAPVVGQIPPPPGGRRRSPRGAPAQVRT